jgi:hypothetical protein
VAHVLDSVSPAFVLVEGPADMNERLHEIDAPHRLPIAVFTYYQHEERTHASWSPLCDYSPEWVAITEGRRRSADVRFMDLPAWSKELSGVRNRYSDGDRPKMSYVQKLCDRFGVDGMDALWDHLFEQPMDLADLSERLDRYFEALRAEGGDVERDAGREVFMARCIRWAMHEDRGDVVAVCGGYHKPWLEAHWEEQPVGWPTMPVPEEGARHGSYLVPYSFKRLDSFVGYEAGMPSPAFYQRVWETDTGAACDSMLRVAVERLRAKKQPVSAADVIATWTMARGLMRLRGHGAMGRTDLLDGVAASLLKDAMEVPLPWTERGPLRPGTDPILVEIVTALSGERVGKLDPSTPRPPLLHDVAHQLAAHDLEPPPSGDRTVRVDLTEEEARERSRVLHRLRVLRIPGFTREKGPENATDAELTESWLLTKILEAESALIEASAWGGTLESAATAKLEEALLGAEGDLAALTAVLTEAVFVGLSSIAGRVIDAVADQAHRETRLDVLGRALGHVLALFRHDTLLGTAGSAELATLIASMYDRGLWLFEGIHAPDAQANDHELVAVACMRDTIKFGRSGTGATLDVDPEAARSVMSRRAVDAGAPPALRGAALGFLWSMGHFATVEEAEQHATRAVRGSATPTHIGDFLAGLFAVAREEVVHAEALVHVIDDIIVEMGWSDFLIAIPALRLAFNWFPPRERDRIARTIVAKHGGAEGDVYRLRKLPVTASVITAGVSLDRAVDEIARRFGLAEELT